MKKKEKTEKTCLYVQLCASEYPSVLTQFSEPKLLYFKIPQLFLQIEIHKRKYNKN